MGSFRISTIGCARLRKIAAVFGLSAAVMFAGAGAALAQAYPARTVKIVVPFPAGGAIDVTARRLAEFLSAKAGQQFIVENTTGAAGMIGARRVVNADPDGYTLLFGTTSVLAINPAINANAGYDPLKDLALVARAFDSPFMLVAHPSVPVKSVAELIAYGKANPGKLNYGSSGVGSPHHVMGELFKLKTGMPMTHVPYKGGAQSVQDVAAGHIQILFENPLSLLPLVAQKKVTALAMTGNGRLALAPDVPTLQQSGVDFAVDIITGIAAPRATPPEIISRLNGLFNEALRDKGVLNSVAKFGAVANPGSPADFRNFIAAELKKWGEVARAANIVVK